MHLVIESVYWHCVGVAQKFWSSENITVAKLKASIIESLQNLSETGSMPMTQVIVLKSSNIAR